MGEKNTTIAKGPEVRESEKNGSEISVRRNSYVFQQPAKALIHETAKWHSQSNAWKSQQIL